MDKYTNKAFVLLISILWLVLYVAFSIDNDSWIKVFTSYRDSPLTPYFLGAESKKMHSLLYVVMADSLIYLLLNREHEDLGFYMRKFAISSFGLVICFSLALQSVGSEKSIVAVILLNVFLIMVVATKYYTFITPMQTGATGTALQFSK